MDLMNGEYKPQVYYFEKFVEWLFEEGNGKSYAREMDYVERIEIRLWEIQDEMEDCDAKDEIIKIILNIEDSFDGVRVDDCTEPFWNGKWGWFDEECLRLFGCNFEDYYKIKE